MNHTPLSLHHKGKQQRNTVNFRHTKCAPKIFSHHIIGKKKTTSRHSIHSLSNWSMYIRKACNQIEKQAHVPFVKRYNYKTIIYHSVSIAYRSEDILTCKRLPNSIQACTYAHQQIHIDKEWEEQRSLNRRSIFRLSFFQQ